MWADFLLIQNISAADSFECLDYVYDRSYLIFL